jgi:hypothetical protein
MRNTETRIAEMIPARKAELETLPADAPTCPSEGHGRMMPRSLTTQTYEQMFCGVWFDCTQPRCRNSRLSVSPELAHQLGQQR